jgi:hypothetical protein
MGMIDQVIGQVDDDLTIEEKLNNMKPFSYGFESRFLCLSVPSQSAGKAAFNLPR